MIWILHGTEAFRRTERRKALTAELLGDLPADFALTVWRGKAFSEARLPELYELPFLASHKVVVLLEAESLGKAELRLLSHYLQNPAPHTRLIVEFAQESAPALPKGAHIHYEAFAPLKPREVTDWLLEAAKSLGLQLEPEAAALLVETLGTDLPQLHQALKTLSVYQISQPQSPLSLSLITEALGLNPHYTVYRLIDALAERKAEEALRIFGAFAEDPRTFPLPQTLWHLRQFYQNLVSLQLARISGGTEAIQKKLKLRFAFQARPYERALRNYTLAESHQALQQLRATEQRLKGVVPTRQNERQLLLGLAAALTAPPLMPLS